MSESEDTKIIEKQQVILNLRSDKTSAPAQSGPPIWLVSFTDVIALMLTFFVLLYSMSNPKIEKWEQKIGITQSAQAQFSGRQNFAGSDEGINLNRLSFAEAENLDYLEILFEDLRADSRNKTMVEIKRTDTALIVLFSQNIIVSNGFNRDFLLFLNRLTPLLKSLDNRLTLTVTSDMRDGFEQLQKIGVVLREYGYRKSVALQNRAHIDNRKQSYAIVIEPHDGRRVE